MSDSSPDPLRTLSVAIVEGIHAAALAGKAARVVETVARMNDSTLPGLVEYLCLRRSLSDTLPLPELPDAVVRSVVGSALERVVCPFGLRTTGRSTPNTQVNPRDAEFFVLHMEDDYKGHYYGLFETRWARAAEVVGLRGKQAAMQLAMTAMVENGLLHAESDLGILVGYRMLTHAVLFTVADLGRGVLGSLRSNGQYAHLSHHRDALRLALQDGVSRLGAGNGFGFRQLFRALASESGTIRFRTGDACVTMDGQDFDADLGEETFPDPMPGFQVTMCCRRESDAQAGVTAL